MDRDGLLRAVEGQHFDTVIHAATALRKAAELDGIALRLGLFHGPGGTDAIRPMLRKRQLPDLDDHGRVLPWTDLVDAANAVVVAVERGRPGQAYNIVDRTPSASAPMSAPPPSSSGYLSR